MYLTITFRDGVEQQKHVDDYSIKDGCLVYYIRFGVESGTHYIPLDLIKEFRQER